MRRRHRASFKPRLELIIPDADGAADARDCGTSAGGNLIVEMTPRDAGAFGGFVFGQNFKRHGIALSGQGQVVTGI